MKALEEMNSKRKYLEKGEAQGYSKRARDSADCLRHNNLELASRASSDVDFCEGKGPEPRLIAQRITIFSQHPDNK